jgi:YbbR domain-containing protein
MLRAIYSAIRHEFGLKLVSVLAAVSLWLYVMNTQDPVRTESYETRISAVNVPVGLVVTQTLPEKVRFTIKGRLSELHKGQAATINVIADLTNCKLGRNQVQLIVMGMPERLALGGIDRRTAQIWLDKLDTRKVSVRPILSGRPREGMHFADTPSVEPEEVELTGPAQTLSKAWGAVARVDVSKARPGEKVRVQVVPVDDERQPLPALAARPEFVEVILHEMSTQSRRVPVHVSLTAPPAGFVVSAVRCDPSEVTVHGPATAIEGITSVSTTRQDITDLRGSRSLQTKLALPSGVTVDDGVTEVKVQVTVRPKTQGAEGQAPSQAEPGTATTPEPSQPGTTPPSAEPPSNAGEPQEQETKPPAHPEPTPGTRPQSKPAEKPTDRASAEHQEVSRRPHPAAL